MTSTWWSGPAIVAAVVLVAMSISLQGCGALQELHKHLTAWKQKQCACFDEWAFKGPNGTAKEVKYKGCAETPDWKNHSWCYVKGGKQCSEAKDSVVPDEKRRWLECDACSCMGTWKYKGKDGKGPETTMNSCAETPDWKGHPWCYVIGGATCKTANPSVIPTEKRKWIECGNACACDDGKWKYKGKTYEGCVKTPDFKDHPWCYAVGGGSCTTAKKSQIKGETRKYVMCNPCDCMIAWKYKGPKGTGNETEYFDCSETPDWKGHNWCYVQGGAACDKAKDSEIKTETRKFIECKAPKEQKFLIDDDEEVGWSPSFGTMLLAGFAGTIVLGGLAVLSFKRIQRGRARDAPISTSDGSEMRVTENLMPDNGNLDSEGPLE